MKRLMLAAAAVIAGCGGTEVDTPRSTPPPETSTTIAVGTTTTTSSEPPRSAEAAIEEWLSGHRDEYFAKNDDPYRGACPDQFTNHGFLCSTPIEGVGEMAIHSVGVYATNWGADLLLAPEAGGWKVVDAEGWPDPEQSFGPPWSPITTIARWWDGRAERDYGPNALHTRTCDERPGTTQPIVCSSLLEDEGLVRVYSSGLARRRPDVYLRLERSTNYEWRVVDTAPVRDDGRQSPW